MGRTARTEEPRITAPPQPYELATLLVMLRKVRDTVILGEMFTDDLTNVIADLERYAQQINNCSHIEPHNRHWCGHPLCPEGSS